MNKQDIGKPREIRFLADPSIADIVTPQGALSRPIRLTTLTGGKRNVIIHGYAHYLGGYATHTREVLFGLGDNYSDLEIGLLPLPTPIDIDIFCEQRLNFYTKQAQRVIPKDQAIYLTIACPAHCQFYRHQRGLFNIIWTMLETPPINRDAEPGSYIGPWLDEADEVWVPTTYDKVRLQGVTSTPIVVMPLGVDVEVFKPETSPLNIVNTKDKFVFLVDATWSPRKGIEYIIEAYCKAFSKNDDTVLLLMSKYGTRPYGRMYQICSPLYDKLKNIRCVHNTRLYSAIEKYGNSNWSILTSFKSIFNTRNININTSPDICLLDVPVHENILANFYASSHCLVGASLGESTWLPGLQALAMGLPIIQMWDNNAGLHDYLLQDYPYNYNKRGVVLADEALWKGTSNYYKGQTFPRPNVDAMANKMRLVYDDYNFALETIAPITERIRKEWAWPVQIKKVYERLSSIKLSNS